MLRLQNGKFQFLRPQPQQPVQDVSVELPVLAEPINTKPDPSTYMVIATRKIDGVVVKTVSDKKTGNVYVITEE